MALSDKKSNLSKVTTNTPVVRTGGVLSQKLSFYKPTFSTNTGLSSGAPQGVTTEAALQAPTSKDTGGSNTATVAPSTFQLVLGVAVQASVTQSIKTVYSTDSGSSWNTFESDFDLQYVPVGSIFQRSNQFDKKYVNPGDNLWIGVYSLSGSVSSSIKFGSYPNGFPVVSQSYDTYCGITNPYKIANISSSIAYYNPVIVVAVSSSVSASVSSSAVIPC
jgi:hypothetical protein